MNRVMPFAPPAAPKTGSTAGEAPVIIGKRTVMDSVAVGAQFEVRPTQLISARVNAPRQWVVTLAQIAKQNPGITPWPYPNNGTTSTTGFLGPGTAHMRALLRWGAGGAGFETQFDYPVRGATFGLLADVVDFNVGVSVDPATWRFAAVGDLPIVGAFMVPGIAADPTPLRWCEPNAAPAASDTLNWSVKPYARSVHINVVGAASNTYQIQMDSYLRQFTGDSDGVYEIPSDCRLMQFINGAGTPNVQVTWHIGLT